MMKPIRIVLAGTLLAASVYSNGRAQRPGEQWRGRDAQRCAVVDCSSASPSPGTPSKGADRAARKEREAENAKYEKVQHEANRVWRAAEGYTSLNAKLDAYQYALQLLQEQRSLRDGPNVRDAIDQVETLVLWTSGVLDDQNGHYGAAVDKLLRAQHRRPALFSEGNFNYLAAVGKRMRDAAPNLSSSLHFEDAYRDATLSSDRPPGAPTGLPAAVEKAIASAFTNSPPGVSERVRKGFQAVTTSDWKVADAWFRDALRLDPNNAGVQSFIVAVNASVEETRYRLRKDRYTDFKRNPLQTLNDNAEHMSTAEIMTALDAILVEAVCPMCRQPRD